MRKWLMTLSLLTSLVVPCQGKTQTSEDAPRDAGDVIRSIDKQAKERGWRVERTVRAVEYSKGPFLVRVSYTFMTLERLQVEVLRPRSRTEAAPKRVDVLGVRRVFRAAESPAGYLLHGMVPAFDWNLHISIEYSSHEDRGAAVQALEQLLASREPDTSPLVAKRVDAFRQVQDPIEVEGFRGVGWGGPLEAIKAEEERTLDERHVRGRTIVFCRDAVLGWDVDVSYVLLNDELVRGKYQFHRVHANADEYLRDWNTLKRKLVTMYGRPDEEDRNWSDQLYVNVPTLWGEALVEGDMWQTAKWDEEDTIILMTLVSHGGRVVLTLEYVYKKMKDAERRTTRQADSEAL